MSNIVTIEFEDQTLAQAFMSYMCEAGEQDMLHWEGLEDTAVPAYDYKNQTITINRRHVDGTP